MSAGLIILIIVLVIDRVIAFLAYRETGYKIKIWSDAVCEINKSYTDIISSLRKDIGELQMGRREDKEYFKHGIGQFDGVFSRFVSLEQESQANYIRVSKILERVDILEEKCAIGNKRTLKGRKSNKRGSK